MKHSIKISLILVLSLVFASAIPVSAMEVSNPGPINSREVICYDDGSYAIVETVVYDESGLNRLMSASRKVSSHRTYTYYNTSDQKAWDFTVNGTFEYNRTRAVAIASSSDYNVYISGWKCVSRSTSKSGATVTGTAKFSYKNDLHPSVTIGMKCSKTGTITKI